MGAERGGQDPITRSGLEAVRILHGEEIRTALTLVFSPTQALLAARAGASMICPSSAAWMISR